MRFPFVRLVPVLVAALVFLGAGCAGPSAPARPVAAQNVFRVRAALLNLLRCPSLTCDVVEDLREGEQVAVLTPEMQGWVQVRALGSGHEGYVLSRFLERP